MEDQQTYIVTIEINSKKYRKSVLAVSQYHAIAKAYTEHQDQQNDRKMYEAKISS